MELKEPKRKKRARLEPKSSLPLVFGSKGELTQFHANLTALGSCIADPTEMEIIHSMGYFGKGSLSRSHPTFGRSRYGAPAVIRDRQWRRREEWIGEVQKLSKETFFDDDNDDKSQTEKDTENEFDKDAFDELKDKSVDNELNNTAETVDSHNTCNSDVVTLSDTSEVRDKSICDIEILDNDAKNSQSNGQDVQVNMQVDEVVLDSNEEEEDICEVVEDNYCVDSFDKDDMFDKDADEDFVKNDSHLQEKVLVLPDSDSDTENYLIDIKPQIKHENFPVRETLHLTFEETFFLMYGLGCLRVVDFDGKYLGIKEVWNYFCKEQNHFLQKYVTYHYFRSKGWIVKPGLKYGGDFILYKEGPPYYHSSYIVIIDILDAVTFKRIESKSSRNMTWNKFIGLGRLADAVGKEVLFAQVLWPSTVSTDTIPSSPDVLSQFTVREILWRRWKLNQDTSSTNLEESNDEDDEDDFSS